MYNMSSICMRSMNMIIFGSPCMCAMAHPSSYVAKPFPSSFLAEQDAAADKTWPSSGAHLEIRGS